MNLKKTSLSIQLAALCLIASMMLFTGCNENTNGGAKTTPSEPKSFAPYNYPDNLPVNVKNIILMIPDGIGHESMKVVDYYLMGRQNHSYIIHSLFRCQWRHLNMNIL
jgi:alkaline phosphatase